MSLLAKQKQDLRLAPELTLILGGPRDSSVVIPQNVGEHRFQKKTLDNANTSGEL